VKQAVKSLLSLKEWDEERAKSRFAEAFHSLAEEEEKLAALKRKYNQEMKRLEERKGAVEAGEILVICEYLSFLSARIEERTRIVERKKVELEKAREELLSATRERKVFTRLLDKLKQAERAELLRAEQSFMDEVAGKRWNGEER